MAKYLISVILVLSTIIYIRCDDTEQCVIRDPKNPCVCFFEDNRKIDISNLFPEKNNSSSGRFLEAQKQNYRFFFHGCTSAQFKPSDYDIQSNDTLTGSVCSFDI